MSTHKTYIIGNWKMYGDLAMARALVEEVATQAGAMPASVEVILCPPATLVREVADMITGFTVRVGGQDCHEQVDGAFTGDISAAMLKDAGAAYVILGHSERRGGHGETNHAVRHKALRAIKTRLIPIICVGETLVEREAGRAAEVVEQQLWESVPEEARGEVFLVAYEPVWAIGTGKTPTAEDIKQMHRHIAKVLASKVGLAAGAIPVVYGGSVKAENARDILTIEGVSGVLVGGASLKAAEFCKIVKSA